MKGGLFEKKDVMYLLSYIKESLRSLQLLKNKSQISLGKLFIHVTIISIISNKKKNNF